ncbi:MAG: hypothetical protein HN366_19900 [Deltaproteobacteria bacterium]|jgi:hypothetical protein|nr:hypothetical protein [Deltaproteobacteria bacterium]
MTPFGFMATISEKGEIMSKDDPDPIFREESDNGKFQEANRRQFIAITSAFRLNYLNCCQPEVMYFLQKSPVHLLSPSRFLGC